MIHEQTGAAIWERLFASIDPALSTDAARAILALKFSAEDQARAHELAAKASEGDLSAAEREQAEAYGEAGSVLSILKSKARQALTRSAGMNGSGA
jgi:hypothetical protein